MKSLRKTIFNAVAKAAESACVESVGFASKGCAYQPKTIDEGTTSVFEKISRSLSKQSNR